MKKCVYCSIEIIDNREIEVCESCGYSVWGPKMFSAIKENMEDAKERGNL